MKCNGFKDACIPVTLIPRGTIAKVKMLIKPGGYDNHSLGLTDRLATINLDTGFIYLNVCFMVLEGEYEYHRVCSRIGIQGRDPNWGNSGRNFIRSIIDSATGLSAYDDSPMAQGMRRLNSIADIDGIEFLARIDVRPNSYNIPQNVIQAITCDHKDYVHFNRSNGRAS